MASSWAKLQGPNGWVVGLDMFTLNPGACGLGLPLQGTLLCLWSKEIVRDSEELRLGDEEIRSASFDKRAMRMRSTTQNVVESGC